MAKLSRPIVYALILGVVGYAVVVLTEPEAPTKRKSTAKSSSVAKAPSGFLPEDLEAKFEKPARSARNIFRPEVVPQNGPGLLSKGGGLGGWILTGITVVGGNRRALLENPTTGDSIFLLAGERWNDLTVQSIEPDAAIFVNKEGRTLRLGFPEPEESAPVAPVTVAVPVVQGAPTIPSSVAPGSDPVAIPADDASRRGRRQNRR